MVGTGKGAVAGLEMGVSAASRGAPRTPNCAWNRADHQRRA